MLGRVVAAACVVFLAAGILLIQGRKLPEPDSVPEAARAAEQAIQEAEPSSAPHGVAAIRDGLREGLRLSPDRRGLAAISWLHHLQTEQPYAEAEARFEAGRWSILHLGRQVGTLPELPDYRDFSALLDDYAATLGAGPLPEDPALDFTFPLERVRRFHHRALLQGLEDLGARWSRGERDARTLDLATRGLAYLCLQSRDSLELSDDIAARAWAMLTLARKAGTPSVTLAETIVAARLGYGNAVQQLAPQLEEHDPARQFFTHDSALLTAEKGELERGALGTFLRALRIAHSQDRTAWVRFLKQAGVSGEAATYLLVMSGPPGNDWDIRRVYGEVTMRHADHSSIWLTDPNADHKGNPERPTIAGFETALAALEERGKSFASNIALLYYRAMFFSGVDYRSQVVLEALASRPAMEAFLEEIGPGESEFAREYVSLLHARLKHLDRKLRGEQAHALVHDSKLQSVWTLQPLLSSLVELTSEHDTRRLHALRALTKRADSRLSHRRQLASNAELHLRDLHLADAMRRSFVSGSERSPQGQHVDSRIWSASYERDTEALWAFVEDPELDWQRRLDAINRILDQPGPDLARVERAYLALIDAEPSEWRPTEAYVGFLRTERKDDPAALKRIAAWLATDANRTDGFDHQRAQIELASIERRAGRSEDAHARLEPLMNLPAGAVLFEALVQNVWALAEIGKREDAWALTDRMLHEYPTEPATRALRVRLNWAWGDWQAAVAELEPAREWSATAWKHHFGRGIARLSRDCSDETAVTQAFQAIAESERFDVERMYQLPEQLGQAGCLALALQLFELLPADPQFDTRTHVAQFQLRRKLHGESAALEWLRPKLSGHALWQAAGELQRQNDDTLLWEAEARFEGAVDAEQLWYERAIAARSNRATSPDKLAVLEEHLAEAGAGQRHTLARYLLDRSSATEVLESARTSVEQCRAGFVLGLRAEWEGRIDDARDWYLAVDRHDADGCPELQSVRERLAAWKSERKSLTRRALEARMPSAG